MVVVVAVFSAFLIIWLLVWQLVAKRLIGLRLKETLMDVLSFLLITLAVFAATHFLTLAITNIYVLLVVRVVLAAVLYVMVMKVAHVAIFNEAWEFMKNKIQRKVVK